MLRIAIIILLLLIVIAAAYGGVLPHALVAAALIVFSHSSADVFSGGNFMLGGDAFGGRDRIKYLSKAALGKMKRSNLGKLKRGNKSRETHIAETKREIKRAIEIAGGPIKFYAHKDGSTDMEPTFQLVTAAVRDNLAFKYQPLPITLSDLGADVAVYRASASMQRSSLHIGQLKLHLNEVQFLTRYAKDGDLVVYAGAAPASHTPYLAAMFPTIEFDLWDPAEFKPRWHADKSVNERVHLHNGFMTDAVAKQYGEAAKSRRILFICDIRSVPYDDQVASDKSMTMEEHVTMNMQMQKDWCYIIKPTASMLKFRLPYESPPEKTTPYLPGEIYLQPWGPQSSSETRLVSTDFESPEVEYRDLEYEDTMHKLSSITREYDRFEEPREYIGSVNGVCDCFDCALEVTIWKEYLDSPFAVKADLPDKTVAGMMNGVIKSIGRTRYDEPHLRKQHRDLSKFVDEAEEISEEKYIEMRLDQFFGDHNVSYVGIESKDQGYGKKKKGKWRKRGNPRRDSR